MMAATFCEESEGRGGGIWAWRLKNGSREISKRKRWVLLYTSEHVRLMEQDDVAVICSM